MVGEGEDNQVQVSSPWLAVVDGGRGGCACDAGYVIAPKPWQISDLIAPTWHRCIRITACIVQKSLLLESITPIILLTSLWHIAAPRIGLGHSLPILQVIVVPRRALALQHLLYKRQNVRVPAHITMSTRRYTHAQLLTHTQPAVHNLGRRKRDLSSAFGVGELIVGVLRQNDCAWSDGCDDSMRVIG
jgi:hypothetical protein